MYAIPQCPPPARLELPRVPAFSVRLVHGALALGRMRLTMARAKSGNSMSAAPLKLDLAQFLHYYLLQIMTKETSHANAQGIHQTNHSSISSHRRNFCCAPKLQSFAAARTKSACTYGVCELVRRPFTVCSSSRGQSSLSTRLAI